MLKRALKIGPGSGLPDRPTSPSWPAFINSQSHRHTLLRSRQRNGSGGLAMLRGSSEGPLSSAKPRASSAPPSIIARGLALFPSVHRAFVGETFDIRSLRRDSAFLHWPQNRFNPVKSTFFRDSPGPTGTPYSYCFRDTSALLPGLGRALPGHPHKKLPPRPDGRGGESPRTEYTVPSPLR